jgi:fatty acid desaturase
MPGAVALQYGIPALAGWLLPLSIYLAYSAGVIAHNHNHCPTFVRRGPNALLGAWISLFYGYPVFAWIPTHNRNHHKFVNRPGDASITWRATPRNGLMAAVTYGFVAAAAQAPLTAAFLDRARAGDRRAYFTYRAQQVFVFGGHAAALVVALALFGPARGAGVYASALGVPAIGALWGLMFTNYVQHVDCDPWSRWGHSRDFTSRWLNLLVFDNGFHSVHHEQPGLHWSELRAAHRRVAHLLDPRTQESSIAGYAFKAYVLGKVLPRYAPVRLGTYERPYEAPSQPRLAMASTATFAPSSGDRPASSTTSVRASSSEARVRSSPSAEASTETSASSPASATARADASQRPPSSAERSTALPPRSKSALSTA